MSKTRAVVSIMEACVICGVTRRTIYNWLESDQIEYVRTAGGCVRIFTDTLFIPGNVKVGNQDISAAAAE